MATALLLALVVLAVGAGVVGLARRLTGDERSSVRDYQHTLDTLRHMSDRRAETGVLPTTGRNGTPASSRGGEPAPAAVDEERTEDRVASSGRRTELLASTARRSRPGGRAAALAYRSGTPPVSSRAEAPPDDSAVNGTAEVSVDAPAAKSAPTRSAADAVRDLAAARAYLDPLPERAMPGARRVGPARATWATAAAVVVIGTITAVAVAFGPSHHPGASSAAARHVTATTAPAVHHSSTSAPKPKTSTGKGGKSTSLAPVTATPTAATYQVGSPSFTVLLTATGPCWVEATDPSTGQVLWEGTLQANDSQQVPSTGQVVVRLGQAHNVTVTVGGQQVQLPPGFNTVIDLTFQTV